MKLHAPHDLGRMTGNPEVILCCAYKVAFSVNSTRRLQASASYRKPRFSGGSTRPVWSMHTKPLVHEPYDRIYAASYSSSDHQYAFQRRRFCISPFLLRSSDLRFVYEGLRDQTISDKVDSEQQCRIFLHHGTLSNRNDDVPAKSGFE
jgi:hypothetical protein